MLKTLWTAQWQQPLSRSSHGFSSVRRKLLPQTTATGSRQQRRSQTTQRMGEMMPDVRARVSSDVLLQRQRERDCHCEHFSPSIICGVLCQYSVTVSFSHSPLKQGRRSAASYPFSTVKAVLASHMFHRRRSFVSTSAIMRCGALSARTVLSPAELASLYHIDEAPAGCKGDLDSLTRMLFFIDDDEHNLRLHRESYTPTAAGVIYRLRFLRWFERGGACPCLAVCYQTTGFTLVPSLSIIRAAPPPPVENIRRSSQFIRTMYTATSHKLLRHLIIGSIPSGAREHISPDFVRHGGAAHGVRAAARKDAVLRLLDALQVRPAGSRCCPTPAVQLVGRGRQTDSQSQNRVLRAARCCRLRHRPPPASRCSS